MKALYPLICFFVLLSSPLFGQLRSTMKEATPFDPKAGFNQTETVTTGTETGGTGTDTDGFWYLFDWSSSEWTWSGAGVEATMLKPINRNLLTFTGATSQHLAAQAFFDAYKAHDPIAAQKVAAYIAIAKLTWTSDAGDDPTLNLADDTHIVYDGGSIELKIMSLGTDTWMVDDVVITAD
ncbi:MAG: hypothetical protein JWO08_4113 [Verrucomicrobiaceae bacterium]|nr:hypothetical protein [Verrucomicrobiaceae bacterium]